MLISLHITWGIYRSFRQGNFFEHGPVALNSQGQLLPRAANETWATYAPVPGIHGIITGMVWKTGVASGNIQKTYKKTMENRHCSSENSQTK
jgi:hypothetical protein